MSETVVIPNAPEKRCPQCGTPLETSALAGLCPACLLKEGSDSATGGAAPSFIPPSVAELAAKFPQLEILELIGKGGMGAVYKARQKELDRFVALKILPPGIGNDAAFAERFSREAKALAKLNHPGIVTIHEFGRAGTPDVSQPSTINHQPLYYFVMEFVDGVNLRQLLQGNRISSREALAIVPQICDALQFAHDHGIVHRDIKPENILLDRRGRVKVADFGLAKLVGTDGRAGSPLPAEAAQTEGGAHGVTRPTATLTEDGKIMGTPNYMAPEQFESPAEVDHRADIYALGVVFYQMLTGELPGKRLEPPSKKVQIDVRLDEIVLRALEKNPDLRYQQASVLQTQVETIAGTPTPDSDKDKSGAKGDTQKIEPANEVDLLERWFWQVFLIGLVLMMFLGSWGHKMWGYWINGFIAVAVVSIILGVRYTKKHGWQFNWKWEDDFTLEQSGKTEPQEPKTKSPLRSRNIRILVFTVLCAGVVAMAFWGAHYGKTWIKENDNPLWHYHFAEIFGVIFLVAYLFRSRRLHKAKAAEETNPGIPNLPKDDFTFEQSKKAEGKENHTWAMAGALASTIFFTFAAASLVVNEVLHVGPRLGEACIVLLLTSLPFFTVYCGRLVKRFQNCRNETEFEQLRIWFRAAAWTALVVSLPVTGLGIFLLYAMAHDTNGWHPSLSEALFASLTWIGTAVLPLSCIVLFKSSRRSERNLPAGKTAALAAVDAWLALMDCGAYARSWETAAPYFQRGITQDEWISKSKKVRHPLSGVVSRKLSGTRFLEDGNWFEAKFDTLFDGVPLSTETVTFAKQSTGEWKAVGYLILPAKKTILRWRYVVPALLVTTILVFGLKYISSNSLDNSKSPLQSLADTPHKLRSLPTAQVIEVGLFKPLSPWAWQELERRDITSADAETVLNGLIAWLRRDHPNGYDQPLNWLDQFLNHLHERRFVTDAKAVEFLEALHGQPSFHFLPRLRETDKTLYLSCRWRNIWHGDAHRHLLGMVLLNEVRSVTMDGQPVVLNHSSKDWDQPYSHIDLKLPALTPGKHTIAYEIDTALVAKNDLTGLASDAPSRDWPPAKKRWTRHLEENFTIYSRDAELVRLVDDPKLNPVANGGFSVRQVIIRPVGERAKAVILLNVSDKLPVPISFDGTLHLNGKSFKCESQASAEFSATIDRLPPEIQEAEIVLTPNRSKVEHYPNIDRIWGKEVVFKNVPLTRHDLLSKNVKPSLAGPPQLRFLAWQEVWKTNKSQGAFHPNGSPVTNRTELAWMREVDPRYYAGRTNMIHFWFSHPFDELSFHQVTLLDDSGKPIPLSGGAMSYPQGSNERNGDLGWLTHTASPAEGTNVPAHVTVRLRYATGALERTQEIEVTPRTSIAMALEGNGQLNGIGQNVDGNAFVSIAVDTQKMKSRCFGVVAVTKDGRELRSGGGSRSGHDNGIQVEQFAFDGPIASVAKFRIGTREIRTMEWKDVILPKRKN